jgi:hypothetical protein
MLVKILLVIIYALSWCGSLIGINKFADDKDYAFTMVVILHFLSGLMIAILIVLSSLLLYE